MSDIKLFQIKQNNITELEGKSVAVEKTLQDLLESQLEKFLGVKFLASEYSTGQKHGGRIDTLGIDENNCPVIIEYKRSTNENVINQGLFYLDWLLDHKAEFQLLVMKKLGSKIADSIEWNNSRLICIAGDYTKYDSYAVEQMNRNIELLRYKKFDELLLLELVNATSESVTQKSLAKKTTGKIKTKYKYKSVEEYYESCTDDLRNRYGQLSDFIFNLGEGIQLKKLRYYYAFKKIKTFASFEFQPVGDTIVIWVHADLSKVKFEKGFTRDVSKVGHHGIGNLEIRIKSDEDIERAKPFIIRSYEIG